MFKIFDVNHDSVVIDDLKIERPNYISVMKWEDFWSFTKEFASFDKKFEEIVELEVEKEMKLTEKDYEERLEKEIESILTRISEDFEKFYEQFSGKIESYGY